MCSELLVPPIICKIVKFHEKQPTVQYDSNHGTLTEEKIRSHLAQLQRKDIGYAEHGDQRVEVRRHGRSIAVLRLQ